MGGKKKDAQRTKGNVRPSSSGRAAELLAAKGQGTDGNAFGFVGFSVSSAAAGLGYTAAPLPEEATGGSGAVVCTDADFRVVLKRMTKRDAVTKLKALQEFTTYSKEKGDDVIADVLQFFPRLYSKLTMEYDRRVREAAQLAIGQLLARVPSRLVSPPCLKAVAGTWLLAQCDPYAPAASAAQAAFAAAFPTSVHQAEAMLSCLDEAAASLLELLLNSSPATLSDPKTTPPEEMVEKHERMLACSLHALRLLLQVVAGREGSGRRGAAPALPEDVASAVRAVYGRATSDARLWKLAKHENAQVKGGFYALVASLCHVIPELVKEKADKICPLVLGNLHATDPVTCASVWEAALLVLTDVKEWWKHVNVRKAVLPSLWAVLRQGGGGCAAVTHPSCLPVLSCLCATDARDAIGDLHGFLSEFLGSMREGLNCDRVQKSPTECAQVAKSFVECVRYTVHCELERGATAASMEEAIVNGQLLAAVRVSIVQTSSTLAKSPFFGHLHELERNWRKRAHNEDAVQRESAAAYARLLQSFWSSLTDLCLTAVRDATGGSDARADHVLGRLADLVCALGSGGAGLGIAVADATGASARSGKKVAFAEPSGDEFSPAAAAIPPSAAGVVAATAAQASCVGGSAAAVAPSRDSLASSSTASPAAAELVELGAAVSAALVQAVTRWPGEVTDGRALGCVDCLTRIAGRLACPPYFAAVMARLAGELRRCEEGAPGPTGSACRELVELLADRALVDGAQQSSQRAVALARLIGALGQHLDSDDARLDVLRRLCAPPSTAFLRRAALQSVLTCARWHRALCVWSASADFRDVLLELVGYAVECLQAGDGAATEQALAAVSQAADCLPLDCAALAEGTAIILKAIHASMTMRPIPSSAVASLEYLCKIFAGPHVPSSESAALGVELYRLLLDCHAGTELDVPQALCCQLAGQLCKSPEFGSQLSEALMSDLSSTTTFDRLLEIARTLSTLEPALSKSFVESFVVQHLRGLESSIEDRLVQWLSILALRCDIVVDSYDVFQVQTDYLATSESGVTPRCHEELPAVVPLICLGFLIASLGAAVVDAECVSDSVSRISVSEGIDAVSEAPTACPVAIRYNYLSDRHFLRISLCVVSCCKAALSSNILSEVNHAYCSKMVDVVTGNLKQMNWDWVKHTPGMLLSSSTTGDATTCSGSGRFGLSAALVARELCCLGYSSVLPDPVTYVRRLPMLTEDEYQLMCVLLQELCERTSDPVADDVFTVLLSLLAQANVNQDLSCSMRILFALGGVLSTRKSLPAADCSSVIEFFVEAKKWKQAPVVAKRSLTDCSAAVVKWNIAAMRLLGLIIQSASSTLTTKHWDLLLCWLVDWTECIGFLDEKRCTFIEMVFLANVSSLVCLVADCMKDRVALQPADYPQSLLSEWVELYCQEMYLNILPQVLSGPPKGLLPFHGSHFVLSCLYRAAAHCPLQRLTTFQPKPVAARAAAAGRAARDLPSDIEAPPGLTYVIERLFVQLRSDEASLQAAAYVLLLKLAPELPKHCTSRSSEDRGITERPVPAVFESTLQHCADGILPLATGHSNDDEPQCESCGLECALTSSRGSGCHRLARLRGYLLTWKLLVKYLQYCSSEVRVEHTEYLKQRQHVDTVLDALTDVMPMEKMASGKPGLYSFSKNATVDFKAGVSLREEVVALSYSLYYSLLKTLPVLVRRWWGDLDRRKSQVLDRFTTRYLSTELCSEEMESTQAGKTQFDNLTVKVRPAAREVVALYTVEEFSMELVIKLPPNYPLGLAEVECSKRLGVAPAEWRTWMLQLTTFLTQQNGSITNAICSWKRNLDKKFEGVEECYICYSVLHGSNLQLPKQQCRTCHKKFHSDCLYKWFSSSQKSTCPLCRDLF